MFWNMLARSSATLWPFLSATAPAGEPAAEPEKPTVGHPDRGSRAQVKAGRKAARRNRRH